MARFKSISIIMLFVVFSLVLFSFNSNVAAADRSYYISKYAINVIVNKDGSADIEERLTYKFKGQFNGVLRDVDFSETKGIQSQSVFVLESGALKEQKLNETSSINYQGQSGTYNFVKEDSLAHFKIFESSSNEEKTFVIRYKFLEAVTKYNDTAEFNRKLIDTKWETRLDNISIKITLPEGAVTEEIKVFAHGPLTGKSAILDARNVEFKVPTVSPGVFVETLVLFPTKLVPESQNIVNENALERIMANEGKLAEEANQVREEARQRVQREEELRTKLRAVGTVLSILLIILWFPVIIHIYRKYDKELSHRFQGKYYRELPGEYTPAEMSVLMSFGTVSTRDIMATLMDLIRKKQLALTSSKAYKKSLFGGKEIITYVIILNEKAPAIELKRHEQFLIDWFIHKIGNGISVTLDEIKDYVKNRKSALQFKSDYDAWTGLAEIEAAKNKFFDDKSKKGRIIGSLLGLAFLAVGFAITFLFFTLIAIINILQGVFLLIFSIRIQRRTAYGNEQHAMWQAFKNFLKEFSRMDKAELPSIVLWEYYLVYAISLGVAKEVIKQLPLVFRDDDLNNNQLTFMYGASYGYFAGFSTMFDDTIRTVEGAITTATNVANSVNSSSSGGGGGFSGGSSGGGGGGGGGGAF